MQHLAHFSRARIEWSRTTISCTITNKGNIMLYTLPRIAQDLGVAYHTLRRWVVTGRIQGVTPPVKGRWSYLTESDVNIISGYVNARLVSSRVARKSTSTPR